MKFRIEEVGPAITEERMRRFEAEIGAELPEDYRRFMLEFNGGRAGEPRSFDVPGRRVNERDTLSSFLSLDSRHDGTDLDKTIGILTGRIPVDAIPIAGCCCGDTVLISVRSTRRGQVLMWDHEGEDDPDVDNVYVVAKNFTEFVNGLYE